MGQKGLSPKTNDSSNQICDFFANVPPLLGKYQPFLCKCAISQRDSHAFVFESLGHSSLARAFKILYNSTLSILAGAGFSAVYNCCC